MNRILILLASLFFGGAVLADGYDPNAVNRMLGLPLEEEKEERRVNEFGVPYKKSTYDTTAVARLLAKDLCYEEEEILPALMIDFMVGQTVWGQHCNKLHGATKFSITVVTAAKSNSEVIDKWRKGLDPLLERIGMTMKEFMDYRLNMLLKDESAKAMLKVVDKAACNKGLEQIRKTYGNWDRYLAQFIGAYEEALASFPRCKPRRTLDEILGTRRRTLDEILGPLPEEIVLEREKNFSKCILENISGTKSDGVAGVIAFACEARTGRVRNNKEAVINKKLADCVLDQVKHVTSDGAATLILQSCKTLHGS